jgi:hypothetical protein
MHRVYLSAISASLHMRNLSWRELDDSAKSHRRRFSDGSSWEATGFIPTGCLLYPTSAEVDGGPEASALASV